MTDNQSQHKPVAFIADSRASHIGLEETVRQLVAGGEMTEVLLELNSIVGITVAKTLHRMALGSQEHMTTDDEDEVPFDVLQFGQPEINEHDTGAAFDADGEPLLTDAGHLAQHARSTVSADAEGLHAIKANIILVPAMVGSGERVIDFFLDPHRESPDLGQTTLPGHIVSQLELGGVHDNVLLLDPPERGLVQQPDGSYIRRIIALNFTAEDTAEESDQQQ